MSDNQKSNETMKAFVLTGHGGMEVLQYKTDWPKPVPNDDQVLIKVGACGLNNTDVNTRAGWYSKNVTEATTGDAYESVNQDDPTWGGAPLSFPRIQGADAVGRVVACGKNADQSLMGKRVIVNGCVRDWEDPLNREKTTYFGSECDGGFAEYTVPHHKDVCVVETDLSDAELATFPCSYSTAEGMLTRANVTENDTVLVTGASGGVGGALVQLAKRRGATVVAMASKSKQDAVATLNPDHIIDRNPEDLQATLKQITGRNKISVVADIVGGAYFGTLLEALERGGRYTCSGAIAGPIVDFDLRTFYLNDLTMTGSTVVTPDIYPRLASYIEKGEVKPVLAATYPLSELHAAQTAFIEKKHTGNIVVTMD